MRDGEFPPLPVQFALNEVFIEAADVEINLVAGKTTQAGDENGPEITHIAGMGHDAGHDEADLAFHNAPDEQDNVSIFLEPADKKFFH